MKNKRPSIRRAPCSINRKAIANLDSIKVENNIETNMFLLNMYRDSKGTVQLYKGQRDKMRELFGKEHITWIDGDHRLLHVWILTFGEHDFLVFTSGPNTGAGTSYELILKEPTRFEYFRHSKSWSEVCTSFLKQLLNMF